MKQHLSLLRRTVEKDKKHIASPEVFKISSAGSGSMARGSIHINNAVKRIALLMKVSIKKVNLAIVLRLYLVNNFTSLEQYLS